MRVHLLVLAAAAAASCTTQRTVGQPTLSVVQQPLSLGHHDKVDILFMIDNSPSMAPKQAELRARFAGLIKQVEGLAMSGAPASFHIGVVDSDLGAGPVTLNNGQCHPDGDGGKLQTTPSPAATDVPSNCTGWALTDGSSYIDYDSAAGTSNTGALSVSDAFNCMASVGQAGCGFEMPLESVYRVLTTPSLNPGFLRDDALLAVVFLTDEDDCSAPPDTNLFNPSSAGLAMWGTLHSFRCTQFGIHCDEHPLDNGAIQTTNCVPVDGGPLFDVARYKALFANGGVKANAADVMVMSIAAPSTPVTFMNTTPCQDQTNTASCLVLDHSCTSATNPQFFGDPAVRLAAVVGSGPNALNASICDDDYESAVASIGDAMGARMRSGCLPGSVVDVNDSGCVVSVDGVDTPRCDGTGTRLPCWDLVEDMGCSERMTPAGAVQQLRFTIAGASLSSVSATCPLYEPSA